MSASVRRAGVPRVALAQLGLAVVLLGAAWPVTKLALSAGGSPAWFAFGRAGLSALASTAVVGATRGLRRPGRGDMPAVLAIGLLQLGAFFALAHAAVAWVPAGRTAILGNATLVWTVPITLLVTHEAISRRRWMATALGAAGVVALAGPWSIDWTEGTVLLGHAFLLGAALAWAVAMTIVRRWPPRQPVFVLLPWAFWLAAAVLLPLALLHGVGAWGPTTLALLGVIGVLMAPLGTWCLVEATAALPLVVASVGFLAGPVLGLVISAVWLAEPVTGSLLAGAALILLGAGVAAGSAAE